MKNSFVTRTTMTKPLTRVDIKAILADPLLREELIEGATDFICKVENIRSRKEDLERTESLSPAAHTVLNAVRYEVKAECYSPWIAAAALRAAADQCKIEWNYHPDYPETESVIIVSDLLAIAAELEGIK